MKKGIAIILIIIALVVGAGGVFVGFYFVYQSKVDELNEEIAIRQANIDAIGVIDKCLTYKTTIRKGQLITEDMIESQDIPASMKNSSYITNKADVVGKFSKVDIEAGTPITADIIMEDDIRGEKNLYNTIREYDVVVNLWPIGMDIGDYVDMRMMMPRGEEYIVLSHMRVYGMSSGTVKFLMTEPQINLYQSALVDYYLNAEDGVMLYFTKYIEPGVQEAANITYVVSDDIRTAMSKNSNLYATAWKTVYDFNTRKDIEQDLIPIEEIDATERTPEQQAADEIGKISGGRATWAGTISGGEGSYEDEESRAEEAKEDTKKGSASW